MLLVWGGLDVALYGGLLLAILTFCLGVWP